MKTSFDKTVVILLTAAMMLTAIINGNAGDDKKTAEPSTGVGRDTVIANSRTDTKEVLPPAGAEDSEDPEEVSVEATESLVSLGDFRLTAYCPCSDCCGVWAYKRPTDTHGNKIVYTASGEIAEEGKTIAVDPSVIPYGTEVIINGKTYTAADCGGAIDNNRIDVYMDDHSEALEFGVQYATVYVKENRYVQN